MPDECRLHQKRGFLAIRSGTQPAAPDRDKIPCLSVNLTELSPQQKCGRNRFRLQRRTVQRCATLQLAGSPGGAGMACARTATPEEIDGDQNAGEEGQRRQSECPEEAA